MEHDHMIEALASNGSNLWIAQTPSETNAIEISDMRKGTGAGLRRRPGSNNVTFDGKPLDGVFVMHKGLTVFFKTEVAENTETEQPILRAEGVLRDGYCLLRIVFGRKCCGADEIPLGWKQRRRQRRRRSVMRAQIPQRQKRTVRSDTILPVFCGAALLLLTFSASMRAQTKAADAPKLVQQLNDKDPAVRGAAGTALGNLKDPAAEPALIAGLKQSSGNVSALKVLVRTLGRFNDGKSVAAIAEILPGEAGHVAAAQLLQMDPLGVSH
jgi:hypothetical protein